MAQVAEQFESSQIPKSIVDSLSYLVLCLLLDILLPRLHQFRQVIIGVILLLLLLLLLWELLLLLLHLLLLLLPLLLLPGWRR